MIIGILLVDSKKSIAFILFESLLAFLILFIILNKNELIPEKEKLILTKAKNLTNISLDGISKLNIKLLNIFNQEKTFLIKNITWNLNKVNENTITLKLDQKTISED